MKKTIGILILYCALSACKETSMGPQITSLIAPADHGILRNLKEVQWPKAYREQDTVLLDKILGDDFQMIDASGTWSDKQGELEWIKENAMQHDSFHYEIKRLDVLDNGTALICGTGHIINDSIETIYQSSNILIKRDGMWKAVASHVSGVKQVE
ncbi:nuclear transport factor 2 family protein [Flagellimonas myxillae]|uniref:nuclear transport factor 2 family protein n=1 Tax=Flagellimonas myxillae TaxID=2942214 RepID=UPI00201F7405|nr:nuclear transport factor 2 family protein [Muricauda myxillae]MCL6266808.1 nuclear transport factor 2 family protein [Muricauda myxillae]